ncbi:MAG: HAMP domain-containing histidine kinase [Prosthecobacter sp.]|jgi:signal transduction histidine kinase|nr:HAMP domain-containing histidine kinase [Prosthecobacter sp.]
MLFKKTLLDRIPSQWRLALLLALFVGTSIALTLILVRSTVSRDLRHLSHSIIIDDLEEYAAIYAASGSGGVAQVFQAVRGSSEHRGLRITSPDGSLLHEAMPDDLRAYPWPERAQNHDWQKAHTFMKELTLPQLGTVLMLGAIRLRDGNILWLGRTEVENRRYQQNITIYLWLAGILAAAVAMLPVVWYSHEVLMPIRAFTRSARQLHLPEGTARLMAPRAIPELKTLASVINAGLDQILSLSRELQGTNDQLAHELRTPLARIRGNLENLLDKSDNPEAKDAAARGLEEIDRAAQLVQSILTIRAGDHGALRLYKQQTSLNDLLHSLVELFTPAAEDRGLALDIKQGLDLVLNIDRQLITQAISNLLDNALAYTPRGGRVTLRWQAEGTGAVLFVEDTGHGVHPEEMEMIWERYNRGSSTFTRHPGMGLGLSLVRAIAMSHGGSVGVTNRVTGGASFWMRLPQG